MTVATIATWKQVVNKALTQSLSYHCRRRGDLYGGRLITGGHFNATLSPTRLPFRFVIRHHRPAGAGTHFVQQYPKVSHHFI